MEKIIYAIFNTLSEARTILGLIKKASWSKADLAMVFRSEEPVDDYEMASENFLSTRPPGNLGNWPGLKSAYWTGIGGVCFASSNKDFFRLENNKEYHRELLKKALSQNRIVIIIKAQSEVTSRVRQLLCDTGNEVFIQDELNQVNP